MLFRCFFLFFFRCSISHGYLDGLQNNRNISGSRQFIGGERSS